MGDCEQDDYPRAVRSVSIEGEVLPSSLEFFTIYQIEPRGRKVVFSVNKCAVAAI
ncbi:aspartate aminotransferase [Anopheles sinensis]|uniref:Aspartate aminotransferase n=1 Tax=Anopheles sinensis TaxID=74873 RepID=A0A084VHY2_ANOSI|nr:aspartate aminotransferase [Anopheles sinensis]